MTGETLQSHLDFARRLMESARPEAEVITALCQRGLDASQASKIVQDLSRGSRSKSELRGALALPRKRSRRSRRSRYRFGPFNLVEWAVVLLILGLAGATVGYLVWHQYPTSDGSGLAEGQTFMINRAISAGSPDKGGETNNQSQASEESSKLTNRIAAVTTTNSARHSTNAQAEDAWRNLFLRQLKPP